MTTIVNLTNPYQTVDAQPDGTVLIVLRGGYNGKETPDEVRIVLTHSGYMDLLASLANHARHGVMDILDDLAAGPCELCNNRRLIDFEKHGHMTNRHCDCVGKKRGVDEMIAEATFPMKDTHHAYDGKTSFEIEVTDG